MTTSDLPLKRFAPTALPGLNPVAGRMGGRDREAMHVLILDDSRSSLARLQQWIEEVGIVRTTAYLDPAAALAGAAQQRFDVAVVDHVMPNMDGIAFIRHLRAIPLHARIPILMVTGSREESVRLAALEAGANDVLDKSPHPLELETKLRNLLTLAEAVNILDARVTHLAHEVETAMKELLRREEEIIFRLSKAVEFRDNDTGEHTLRVANYSRMIAERMGWSLEECRRIYLASPLHDVGKVAIPDHILLKPGRLDAAETERIRTHAEIGARLLGGSGSRTVQLAAEIAASHHERWDGGGYPHGLQGEDIPLSARIVAVADVFDALTTERSYKRAMSTDAALAHLVDERGRHFDPDCVDAFLAVYETSANSLAEQRPGNFVFRSEVLGDDAANELMALSLHEGEKVLSQDVGIDRELAVREPGQVSNEPFRGSLTLSRAAVSTGSI